MNIVVTCGYNQSLHAIALINELKSQGHNIVACLSVRTFQINRLKVYLKMYGLKTLIKKYQNAVLNKENELYIEAYYINNFLEKNNITSRTVKSLCQNLRIQYLSVKNLNNEKSYEFLSAGLVDLIVYAGGGILRKNIINIPKYGAINAHSGYLPFFRGMNVIEWSLLYNIPPTVSVHMISPGIDTGDILYRTQVPSNNGFSIQDIRGKSVLTEVKSLLKVVSDFNYYYNNRIKQSKNEGKQYFVMHDTLKAISEKNLHTGKWLYSTIGEAEKRFN